jgi:hypothetical protein
MSLSLHKQYLQEYIDRLAIKEESREQYESSILLQRERSPDYPFYGIDLNSPNPSNLKEFDILQLINKESYKFSGVKYSKNRIYKSRGEFQPQNVFNDLNIINDEFRVQDIPNAFSITRQDFPDLYLEYVNTRTPNPNILAGEYNNIENRYNWKYLYLPIDSSILNKINLPYLEYWDTSNPKPVAKNIYPYNALLRLSGDISLVPSNTLSKDLTNPLYPGFIFNNKTYRLGFKREMIVYEYIDIEGKYGRKGERYVSTIKPLDLPFPEGFPVLGDLEVLECNKRLIGYMPSKGFIGTDIGLFTGITTTSKYSYVTSYLYKRIDGSVFLSDAIPSKYARDFIDFYFGDTSIGFITEEINTFIGSKVTTTELAIWIEEFNCIRELTTETYYNDSTIIDDSLYHYICP